jgi:hypothetical protein
MSGFFPYGGYYSGNGHARRNEPVCVPASNPLPANKMACDTGNAGADGYTVLSRADRDSDMRPIAGTSEPEGPRMSEDN